MTYIDIINRLIGDIHPTGESHIDEIRYKYLKETCEIVDYLISEIRVVALSKNRQEHSMKKMGEYADEFLKEIGII